MNTTAEERNEMSFLVVKQILNSFPIVGPILTDIFFTYRSNIRQARLNHFTRLLEDEFIKLNIDLKTLKTEENLDLFEGIFKKVVESRSEAKRIGFKNILVHGLKDNQTINYCEIFSDLLLNIRDKELEILEQHKRYLINDKGALVVRNSLKEELYNIEQRNKGDVSQYKSPNFLVHMRTDEDVKKELQKAEKLLEEYESKCSAKAFLISEDEYKYFVQDLFSKGLLFDDGVGAIETRPFEIMSLTSFGIKFLSFIEK